MLKAVIFDFDGVIADAEPIHLKCFKEVLAREGIELSENDYYSKYLAYDDRTCFAEVLKAHGQRYDELILKSLIERKSLLYNDHMKEHIVIYPGVTELIKELHGRFPLAIGSGALRAEIEYVLQSAGLNDRFSLIVSAEDVEACKPDPEVYVKALTGLEEQNTGSYNGISPGDCIVIEDSIHGIEAAKRAGMKCLAVTNTYSEQKLRRADMIVGSLEDVGIEMLEGIFSTT
ncbi:MAG: HAD family phosphatase [Candidatus Dadabacteria bacterium]|nr:HAD family phosphatase [Candidatus Dadabacteria bacterium]